MSKVGFSCLLIAIFQLGQVYGQEKPVAFQFVEQAAMTKLSALGGVNITTSTDALFFTQNPSSMDSSSVGTGSFHYMNFPGGINWGSAGYQWAPEFGGQIALGLQLVSYGQFEGFDELGIATGDFSAQEFALQAGYSRTQGVFTYGVNVKILGSVLDSYQAYALAFDFGVTYRHPVEDLKFALVIRNLGFPLSTYLEGQKLALPQDVRLGASFKPRYMPLRFHWTLRNLNRQEDFISPEEQSLGSKAFEIMVWGVEILPSPNFSVLLGYNQLIRREFQANVGPGAAGFSGGFSFRVKSFEFSYSRAFYQVAGASNLFGVSTSFNKKRSF